MFSKPKCSIWHFNAHYLRSGFITIAPQQKSFKGNIVNIIIPRAHVQQWLSNRLECHYIYIYRISSILARAILFKLPFGSEVFEGAS